jgi:hypothetical protein
LVDDAPAGPDWLHEVKYDGYRMHARIAAGKAQLLTRTGLDWSHRYRFTINPLQALDVKSAYLDGELCALGPDGVPAFSRLQTAMDEGRTEALVFMAFDLLFLNGENYRRAVARLASYSPRDSGASTAPRKTGRRQSRWPALTYSTFTSMLNFALPRVEPITIR